ncbi:MAG TPA: hypothetical protein VJ836_05265 [Candidatus Saccharimonadales bacterium]|nr:hypothetical protein [Candidatus Saccharimonadales bacterium]
MKTTNRHEKPFHLHLEYFFRKQYCLLAVLALLLIALVKTEGRLLGVVREAYAYGYGIIGQYMREETTRELITSDVGLRAPTTSGK